MKMKDEKVVASSETTWELMLRSFSSVHTLEYKCSKHLKDVMEDSIPVPLCRIAVVGTFKDELLKFPNHEEELDSIKLKMKDENTQLDSIKMIMKDENTYKNTLSTPP